MHNRDDHFNFPSGDLQFYRAQSHWTPNPLSAKSLFGFRRLFDSESWLHKGGALTREPCSGDSQAGGRSDALARCLLFAERIVVVICTQGELRCLAQPASQPASWPSQPALVFCTAHLSIIYTVDPCVKCPIGPCLVYHIMMCWLPNSANLVKFVNK